MRRLPRRWGWRWNGGVRSKRYDIFYEDDKGGGTFVLLGNGRTLIPEGYVSVNSMKKLAALESNTVSTIASRLFAVDGKSKGIMSSLKEDSNKSLIVAKGAAF